MKVLVTGASGFIGKNLCVHLAERSDIQTLMFNSVDSPDDLASYVQQSDFIFHLAGVNRPEHEVEFAQVNAGLTERLCDAIRLTGRAIPVVYTSSIHAAFDNAYGRSKLAAETRLLALSQEVGSPVCMFRLPNVFGKWSRPNYNSVVATFCHNIANGLPIRVDAPDAEIELVYVDDVVHAFLCLIPSGRAATSRGQIYPRYRLTVGELAKTLEGFREGRDSLMIGPVGSGLTRALYSTYLSYHSPAHFSYELKRYEDQRGVFVEMLKTGDSGQVSYFTAHPGVTRGGHYHHTKTEKFLVVKGRARFRFRHIDKGTVHEMFSGQETPQIVESIPGWTHYITNVGPDEMIVMLWANEVFDRNAPDTILCPV
jgi:UDP-2-acetamido-2,6-beta-L-arabino-hexul-4-ose reductase